MGASNEGIDVNQQSELESEGEAACYYSIRLLITHPMLSMSEVTNELDMEPDYSWNAGDRTFTSDMMWGRTSWTEGTRLFFAEVHEILEWLQERQAFVSSFVESGGKFQVIVQLPGSINTGDVMSIETMALAVKLGITIGVEVFPNLPPARASSGTEL